MIDPKELAFRMAMANIGKPMAYDGKIPAPTMPGASVTDNAASKKAGMDAELAALQSRLGESEGIRQMQQQMGERGQMMPPAKPAPGRTPYEMLASLLGGGQ